MTVGERIRIVRENADMTQEQLGQFCGTTKQTIFKYERNIVTNIPLDKLEKIAAALSVDPAYLMGWQQEKPAPTGDELDKELIEIWNTADRDERRDLLDMARMLKSRRK